MESDHGLVPPPPGTSVNDGIDPAFCSLSYVTVDRIARMVAALGKGALMAKVDVEAAYRLVPIHPDDRPLLAIRWHDETFCDGRLPFGLRSAPKIFNTVADALEWHVRRLGVSLIYHYLDDFIVLGPPGSSQCQRDLELLEEGQCRRGQLGYTAVQWCVLGPPLKNILYPPSRQGLWP